MIKQPPEQYAPGYLEELDGRTAAARLMRQRFIAFTNDLGGADHLSYAQRSLVERGLWLEFWMAQQEECLARGDDFDVARWTQAANSLQGIYSKLGLERKARDVPDLQSILSGHQQRGAA